MVIGEVRFGNLTKKVGLVGAVFGLHENELGHGHIDIGGIPKRDRGTGSRRYLRGRICGSVNFGTVKSGSRGNV